MECPRNLFLKLYILKELNDTWEQGIAAFVVVQLFVLWFNLSVMHKKFKKIKTLGKLNARWKLHKQAKNSISFAIEVTTVCDLKCAFCPSSVIDRGKHILPLEKYTDILKKVRIIADRNIDKKAVLAISGMGEIFIIPNICDYLIRAREILPDVGINVASNFTTVKRETLETIMKNRLIDKFSCSMNYYDEKLYREICGRDYLAEVFENIDRFVDYKEKHGSGLVLDIAMKKHENLTPENMSEFELFAKKRWKDGVAVCWSEILNWGGHVDLSRFVQSGARLSFPCYSLFLNNVLIDWNGNVYPCCCCFTRNRVEELRLGNILDNSFDEMKGRLSEIRKTHSGGEWNRLDLCSECNIYTLGCYDVFFKLGNRYY